MPSLCIVSYCSLDMNMSTVRKALEMRFLASEQFLPSGHPFSYSTGWDRQLFLVVTLETAIQIFLPGDNLQFSVMEYDTYYSICRVARITVT